jgi:hypothetical protein
MKRLFVNTLLVFASITFSVIIGELLLRAFYPQDLGLWSMTREGMTIHLPNLKRYLPKFKQTIQINSYGMRDREHTLEKIKGSFRILLLGDSFMEAYQVSLENSFPRLLEGILNSSFDRPIEVVNASVSGWGTDDELLYLMRYGLQFNPDLILIAMTLHNDISDNLRQEYHVYSKHELYEKSEHEIPFAKFLELEIKTFLATRSHLYQLFLRYWRSNLVQASARILDQHLVDLVRVPQGERIIQGWDMTSRLLAKTKVIGKTIGASTALFLLPLRIQTSDDTFNAFLARHGLENSQVVLAQPQTVMESIGLQEGIEVIDLLPKFRELSGTLGKPLYVEGDGHWNEYGHSLAAKIVAKELLRRKLIGSSAPNMDKIEAKMREAQVLPTN